MEEGADGSSLSLSARHEAVPPAPILIPTVTANYVKEGERYRLGYLTGYGQDFYGVWDLFSGLAEQFPLTDEGWIEAWKRFTTLEPAAAEHSREDGGSPRPPPQRAAARNRARPSPTASGQAVVGLLSVTIGLALIWFGGIRPYMSNSVLVRRGVHVTAKVIGLNHLSRRVDAAVRFLTVRDGTVEATIQGGGNNGLIGPNGLDIVYDPLNPTHASAAADVKSGLAYFFVPDGPGPVWLILGGLSVLFGLWALPLALVTATRRRRSTKP